MTKVKIRTSSNSSELKGKLLELFMRNSIKVLKLLPVSDGFLCFCASADDADKLFATNVFSDLMSKDCEPIKPQQLNEVHEVGIVAQIRRRHNSAHTNSKGDDVGQRLVFCERDT